MSSLSHTASSPRQGGAPAYTPPISRPAPHYCEVADYDREIDDVKAYLKKLVYARRCLKQHLRMKDPANRERAVGNLKRGLARFWADPERNSSTREKHRRNQLAAVGLPPMTRQQTLKYRDLRRRGGKTRKQALEIVLS